MKTYMKLIKKRLFSLLLVRLLFSILVYVSIAHLFLLHSVDYEYISRDNLQSHLFRKVSPNLNLIIGLPKCEYLKEFNKTAAKVEDNIQTHTKNARDYTEGIKNGTFAPIDCNPEFSVAILVPYRDRKAHLDIFFPHMHEFLKRQHIHYRIYLIEQEDSHPWNKGVLYNVGARQAIRDGFPCLIFHDIDILPLDKINLYACTKSPRHMSALIDDYRMQLIYVELFGGVVSMTSEQYVDVNGFSNKFDDWGGEDDELRERIVENGYFVVRYPPEMSRYKMLLHKKQPRNPDRWIVRAQNRRTRRLRDGFDSVDESVEQVRIDAHPLYVLVGVKRKYEARSNDYKQITLL